MPTKSTKDIDNKRINLGSHSKSVQWFCSGKQDLWYFIFCWPCISLQILGNKQLDALFHIFIYFMSLHVSCVTALIMKKCVKLVITKKICSGRSGTETEFAAVSLASNNSNSNSI